MHDLTVFSQAKLLSIALWDKSYKQETQCKHVGPQTEYPRNLAAKKGSAQKKRFKLILRTHPKPSSPTPEKEHSLQKIGKQILKHTPEKASKNYRIFKKN